MQSANRQQTFNGDQGKDMIHPERARSNDCPKPQLGQSATMAGEDEAIGKYRFAQIRPAPRNLGSHRHKS